MKSVLVLGGYGVFGSLIAKELAKDGLSLTVAGRDEAKARNFAPTLGQNVRGIALDVRDEAQCLKAFTGHAVVVHCAGPFSAGETAVLEAALAARCHYADIADDRAYAAAVRSFDSRFREAKLAAVYGASSLPGISGALASRLRKEGGEPPARIRVTLFIGNKNPKGEAAVRSAFGVMGKEIAAPQGAILGFGDPETVELPPPWGKRTVYNFESPDYDLLPERFGAASVSVKLGFEFRFVTRAFALLARCPKSARSALLRPLLALGNAFSRFGTSGGAVVVEFFPKEGPPRREVLAVREGGQTMAIRPCVAAVRKLLEPTPAAKPAGVLTVTDFLGAEEALIRPV